MKSVGSVFGTVPNLDGLSWENYDVFQDAELSQIPNLFPICSRLKFNVTLHVAVDNFHCLIPIPNSLSPDAFIQIQNAPNPFSVGALPRTPLGERRKLPQTIVGWGWDTPYPSPLVPRTVSQVSIIDLWSPYQLRIPHLDVGSGKC